MGEIGLLLLVYIMIGVVPQPPPSPSLTATPFLSLPYTFISLYSPLHYLYTNVHRFTIDVHFWEMTFLPLPPVAICHMAKET